MAADWAASIVSAISGLGGVALGGWMTSRRESRREAKHAALSGAYPVILVSAHLEKFVSNCDAIAYDDGTLDDGSPAGDQGENTPTTLTPVFAPLSLDVDWKVLPPTLAHRILRLPYKVETLNASLSQNYFHDDPPDYSQFFWSRQSKYTALGLEVCALIRDLWAFVNMPMQDLGPDDFDVESSLRCHKARLEKMEQEREALRARGRGPPPISSASLPGSDATGEAE